MYYSTRLLTDFLHKTMKHMNYIDMKIQNIFFFLIALEL